MMTEYDDSSSGRSENSTAPDENQSPYLDRIKPFKIKLIPCKILEDEEEDPIEMRVN